MKLFVSLFLLVPTISVTRFRYVQHTPSLYQSGEKVVNSVSNDRTLNFTRYNYFKNLTDYSPLNIRGSCGFVSLVQVLSYYDTFFNETIISDTYEQHYLYANNSTQMLSNSPGTRRTPIDSSQSIYNYTITNKHNDFQCLLFYANLQSVSGVNQNNMNSTSMYNYQTICNYLFGTGNIVFHTTEYTTYGCDYKNSSVMQAMESSVKALLSFGYPVILHIRDDTGASYHSVVAYNVNTTNNRIYCHFGWDTHEEDSFFDTLDNQVWFVTDICYLTFPNWSHIHSDNYIYLNTHRFCGCGHEHNYSLYSQYNNSYHKLICSVCNSFFLQPHIFELSDIINGENDIDYIPEYTCSVCGYTTFII